MKPKVGADAICKSNEASFGLFVSEKFKTKSSDSTLKTFIIYIIKNNKI